MTLGNNGTSGAAAPDSPDEDIRAKGGPRFQLVQTEQRTLRWRLLGRNNVSLGTGTAEHARAVDCVASIAWLKSHLDVLRADFSHVSGGRWRWRLGTAENPVAEATHAYGRRIEAQRGLERFRLAVREAAVDTGAEALADWRRKYRRN